jgi:hypothetical protein
MSRERCRTPSSANSAETLDNDSLVSYSNTILSMEFIGNHCRETLEAW